MTDQKPFRFQFFLPNARLMSASEIERLSAEKNRAGGAPNVGLWLEMDCPDRSCLDSKGNLTLPVQGSKDKGIFLNLFCPEDTCEILQSSDLP